MTTGISARGESRSSGGLRVGDWSVDPARNEVSRGGELLRLEPKVIEVLVYLTRKPGEVIGREELLSSVWPGVIVGDDALTQAIIKLRKAFGDDAHQPRYIETISKRGYRLIAPVTSGALPAAAPAQARAPFARRLRVFAVVALVAIALGAVLFFPRIAKRVGMPWPIAADTKGGVAAAAMPIIAVLPLSNLSGDPKRDYFSDGMTEDIIAALGRFSAVRVMSRNAVQGYKGMSPSPQAIHSELGARYIVQGSIREADGKLRVAVELSDADKGVLLWSERYDVEGTQLFEVQDRIVRNIVGVLAVKLNRLEQERVFATPTESLEAYDLVLRARELLDRNERGANREARALLARAQSLAPEYADVLAVLADAEFERVRYGWIEDAVEGTRRAEELAKRALTLPDQRVHTRAHTLLASIASNQNRAEEALQHAERAIELNASDSAALSARGMALLYIGRTDEAIAAFETAKRFDPQLSGSMGINIVLAYYMAGRYREAVAQADAVLARIPDHMAVTAARAAALAQLGNVDEARQAADQVRRLSPLFRVEYFGLRFEDPKQSARIQEGLRKAGL